MSVLAFCQWCNDSAAGQAIRDSIWMFPAVEAVHLLALAVLGGAVFVTDLRLCGLGLTRQPVARLAEDVHPWLVGSLVVMVLSGALLFASEALKCYENPAFWTKMAALAIAILFTFTVRRRILAATHGPWTLVSRRAAAAASFAVWTVVGAAGRGIGFY